jgi:hypothetical protein
MNSIETIRTNRRLLTLAVCGVLAFFTASSFGQQEGAPKPLLDAPLSSLLLVFDASKLAGDTRRTFDVLTLIIEDTDKATTEEARNGYLQEFLIKSQDFAREHPDSLPLWTLRAVAALEVNQATAGREACQRMIKLKAGDSDDPKTRRVLALLDRKDWFNANALNGTATAAQVAAGPEETPRARPVLQQAHTRPAVFEENDLGTSNIGPVAFNAKWKSCGAAYLHKMMEAMQSEWDRILIDSKIKPPPGSYVTVKFTMDWKGNITKILDVESTSSEQGKQSCITAITTAAPFGEWTDNMIATFGSSQELTFKFYYE